MSKTSKTKKNKVPKITEAEYARYIASLKSETAEMQAPLKVAAPLEELQTTQRQINKL